MNNKQVLLCCSVTCGPGYQVRWRLHNNVSEGPFEAQVRKCAHKLSVDCNSEGELSGY